MERRFFVLGSISGGMAVALGAFGAHVLKSHLTTDMLANFGPVLGISADLCDLAQLGAPLALKDRGLSSITRSH